MLCVFVIVHLFYFNCFFLERQVKWNLKKFELLPWKLKKVLYIFISVNFFNGFSFLYTLF